MNFFYEHAPSISLILFFSIFLLVAYRTYKPGMKHKIQAHAFIPLMEEDNHE